MLPNRAAVLTRLNFVKTFVGIALLFGALSACSFAPVYGDPTANAKRYTLSFDAPSSRLQQIVYQNLIASFGNSNSPSALNVTVRVSGSNLNANAGSVSLDGDLTITRLDPAGVNEPQVLYKTTRTATATKIGGSQSVSNQPGAVDTSERAAIELAQNIRVTLLSVLAVMDKNSVLDQPYGTEITVQLPSQ